jgi:hypothetical protein
MNLQGPLVLEIGASALVHYPLEGQQWFYPESDSVDLAYTIIDKQKLLDLKADVHSLTFDSIATQEQSDGMRVGDEIVSAGLLVGASGTLANYPIFKWGNISSFNGEPIHVGPICPQGKSLDLFEGLVAASLVPGNSGSPIFVIPNEQHPGNIFLAGVQSISILGNDVAGMAPIRSFVDSLKHLDVYNDLNLQGSKPPLNSRKKHH